MEAIDNLIRENEAKDIEEYKEVEEDDYSGATPDVER